MLLEHRAELQKQLGKMDALVGGRRVVARGGRSVSLSCQLVDQEIIELIKNFSEIYRDPYKTKFTTRQFVPSP
jgi:hypothetical protein